MTGLLLVVLIVEFALVILWMGPNVQSLDPEAVQVRLVLLYKRFHVYSHTVLTAMTLEAINASYIFLT